MNNFLLIVASILVVALGALFAVPPMINWNDYRGAFEEEASRLLDREVRVRGEVALRLLPMPYVSFEKVRIADAPGIPGSIARAEQFKLWLSVPPLLRGVFEARQVELEKPVLRLRAEKEGNGNWAKLKIKSSGLAFLPRNIALNAVHISSGTLLFESYQGNEIAVLNEINGELTAGALSGPYKFIGSMPIGGREHEVRLSTAPLEDNGEVRFSGSVRAPDNETVHTLNGTLHDLLGKARAEGRLVSRGRTTRNARATGYELTSKLLFDATALRLDDVAISFQTEKRQQTLNGSVITSWRDRVVTETNLTASWLDLDAVAGTEPGEGPLRAVERLLTGGVEPLGVGLTSVNIAIDQANLAGTSISDFSGRFERKDGVTKIEALRASLPGNSALAVDGFLESRENALQFDGNLLLRSASFTEFAKWLRLSLPESSHDALATAFALDGAVRLRPKSVELSNARVSLSDALAEGSISYAWGSRPVLVADIDADDLKLEKFGNDLLEPSRLAAMMGLGSHPAPYIRKWQRETDVSLRLRAAQISDGARRLSDVDVDFGRSAEALSIARLKFTWRPGLRLELSGNLNGLSDNPRGSLTGFVAAGDDTAAGNLAELASLAAASRIPASLLTHRAPLRLALDAEIGTVIPAKGKAPGAGGDTARASRLVADGVIGEDRIRIVARTSGRFDEWLENPAAVEARVTGDDVRVTMRRLLGSADGRSQPEPTTSAQPVTVVMSAAGTPSQSMKTFVRVAAGQMLDADFTGSVKIEGDKPPVRRLAASWSGNLDFRTAGMRTLAGLTWPSIIGHINDLPVMGRIAVSRTPTELSIESHQLAAGETQVRGTLQLTGIERDVGTPKLTGNLSLSKVALPALTALLMRSDASTSASPGVAPDRGPETAEATSPWPDAQFDFNHLSGLETDVDVKVRTLAMHDGARLRNASFKLATAADKLTVSNFQARLGKATVLLSADFKRSDAGADVTAVVSGRAVPLSRWAPEIARAKRLSGTADFDLKFNGQALSPRSLTTLAEGTGEIRLKNASVPGITSATVSAAARQVIDGELEVEGLKDHLAERVSEGVVRLGSPKLDIRIANGTIAVPSIVHDLETGTMRNATVVDLRSWRIDSQWTVTPAPQPRPDRPEETVPLPPVTVVYTGPIASVGEIEPVIGLGDLERELIVRKMEANVARLERLRREDEARAAAEAERQRLIEEEQRRSIEEESRRRQQGNAQNSSPSEWRPLQSPPPAPAVVPGGVPAVDLGTGPQASPRSEATPATAPADNAAASPALAPALTAPPRRVRRTSQPKKPFAPWATD